MLYKSLYLILFFILSSFVNAQFYPINNSELNYTQVLFQFKEVKEAHYYKLRVVEYDSTYSKAINNRVVTDSNTVVILKQLNLGSYYKWFVEAFDKQSVQLNKSSELKFSIYKNDFNDTTMYRVNQFVNKTSKYKDGIIWLDKYFCALDRSGNVVWQFPKKGTNEFGPIKMVDLHMCNNGNIVFSNDTAMYYFTKDLKLIWKKHVSDIRKTIDIENIHHVFNRLPNGNFVTIAARTEKFKLDKTKSEVFTYDGAVILEFDSVGKLIWHWDFREHFDTTLIKDYLKIHGVKNLKLSVMLHSNAVSYDSTYKHIYFGLRDFSRVIKIDKASKKIIAEYGEKLSPNDTKVFETKLFSRQHDVKPIGNNQIMVFSNGEDSEKGKSYVLKLQLPTKKNEQVKKLWELDLDVDTIPGKANRYGSAQILPNKNILICGGTNGRILEVTQNKEPVWDLYLRAKTMRIFNWGLFAQYRAYYNSSLYPYFFSCSKFNSETKTFQLYNDGSDDDDYRLEIFSKNNSSKQIETISSLKLKSETNTLVKLNSNNAYSVKITSLNSGKVQVYYFE